MPIVAMPFGKTNLLIRRLFVKSWGRTTVCCSGPGFSMWLLETSPPASILGLDIEKKMYVLSSICNHQSEKFLQVCLYSG